MAGLPMIDTDYKPDGPLGALYQGYNAANANDMAGLELVKQYLANQREQSSQPLDLNIKQTESDYATMKRDPRYMDAAQRGYIGQMNTQDAAGRKAMSTADGEIDLTNAQNKNKLSVEELLARLNELKRSRIESVPSMGFNMQPQEPLGSVPVGDSGILGNFAQGSPEANLKAIQSIKNPEDRKNALAAFTAYQDKRLAQQNVDTRPSVPQGINANNSPIVPQPPLRNGGITPGAPEYEAVMQALTDTPELRAALIKGDQKLDSSEFNQMLKLLAERERLAGRSGGDKPPKTFEEFIARVLVKKSQGIQLSPDEESALQEAAGGFNAKNAAKIQPGTTLATEALPPGTPLKEKPPQQQYVPNTSSNNSDLKKQVEGSGIVYEPDKYDYRVVDGKVQRKLKGK